MIVHLLLPWQWEAKLSLDMVHALCSRDKHATRARMAEARLPTPRNFLIEQESQVEEAAELVKFPAGVL